MNCRYASVQSSAIARCASRASNWPAQTSSRRVLEAIDDESIVQ